MSIVMEKKMLKKIKEFFNDVENEGAIGIGIILTTGMIFISIILAVFK